MARVIVYFAHPGQRYSRANVVMLEAARRVEGITIVDLYAEYPRFHIDIEKEQARLRDHDVIVFQYPLFWYSCPSLVKEWLDLVLEHGFAYGQDGDALAGKRFGLAVTAAGDQDAYTPEGYQHHDIRTFLTPMEQTAKLCQMQFLPPYVLFGALRVSDAGRQAHVQGYARYLEVLRDDRFDPPARARTLRPEHILAMQVPG